MRMLIAVGALVAAAFMTAPRAEATGFCYDGEQGLNCGFVSFQQCLDARSATATGTCYVHPLSLSEETIRTQSRRHVTH